MIAFGVNFSLSRIFVFSISQKTKLLFKEFISILIISIIGLAITEYLLVVFIEYIKFSKIDAKIVVSIIVMVWNYFARRLFVYNKVKKD